MRMVKIKSVPMRMDKINSIPIRVDPAMKKLFNKVRIEKLKTGETLDLKELSDRRLSLAVTRIPDIEETLIKSKIKNKV